MVEMGIVCICLREVNKRWGKKQSEVDSANASGTQALTFRGLSNPRSVALGSGLQANKRKVTLIVQKRPLTQSLWELLTNCKQVHTGGVKTPP